MVTIEIPAPRPTVGRIVHYKEGTATRCEAAIVIDVDPDTPSAPDLFVFDSAGTHFPRRGVVHSQDQAVGRSWHWPERE